MHIGDKIVRVEPCPDVTSIFESEVLLDMSFVGMPPLLNGWVAVAVFVVVAMVGPGCSTQQNHSAPEAQSLNLPAVASLDDYLAQESNDNRYIYASYGPYDPFMIDPFSFAPYWYALPVYYFPGGGHRHEMGSSHFSGFGGMRGFDGHMGGGRR